MRYLFDTNVVSETVSKRPNPLVMEWIESIDQNSIYLSAITIGEVHRGIQKLPESARRQRLRDWFENDLMIRYSDRILIVDVGVMLAWGTMVNEIGRTIPMLDSLLAAQALHHRCELVTRNEEDFRGSGVAVINPWK